MSLKISPPNISVVIPTHKRPALLKRAIESVLNQTVLPFEILIVDDIGSDDSKEVVKSFNQGFLRYIHNEDGQGASSSRNLGAQLAEGEFIAFLDDDDEWLPSKIEKQLNLIKKNSLDACFSQIQVRYENTDITYTTKSKKDKNYATDILMENFIGATISSIISKKAFLDVGGFDINYDAREEYDLWIKLITNNYSFDIIEEPLAVSYRSLESRQRISSNIESYITAMDRLNKKHKAIVDSQLNEKQKKVRTKVQYEFLAAQEASIGLRKESVKYYAKSLLTIPNLKSCIGLVVSAISPILLIKIRSRL